MTRSISGTAAFQTQNRTLRIDLYLSSDSTDGPLALFRLRPPLDPRSSAVYPSAGTSTEAVLFPEGLCSVPYLLHRPPEIQLDLTRSRSGDLIGQADLEVEYRGIYYIPGPRFCEDATPERPDQFASASLEVEFVATQQDTPSLPFPPITIPAIPPSTTPDGLPWENGAGL